MLTSRAFCLNAFYIENKIVKKFSTTKVAIIFVDEKSKLDLAACTYPN